MCFTLHVRKKVSHLSHFVPLTLTTISTKAGHKSIPGIPWCRFILMMDDGLERTQEGSWKWILSIISGPVSWPVAGMVSRCSRLLGRPSQNPAMVSESVDARARCHLGTWIDEMTAITLHRVQMNRKMSLVPAAVAAPNPSAKNE